MIKKQNPKTLFEKKDKDLTTVLKPSQINFPGQINDYLNNFFLNTCMRLELTDYNNMCSMIVTRETSK